MNDALESIAAALYKLNCKFDYIEELAEEVANLAREMSLVRKELEYCNLRSNEREAYEP